jgi:purine-binding chemotaxis protein CheW
MSRLTRTLVTPAWVAGVMNLRGEILSVLDIRTFLGLDPGVPTDATRVIVTDAPWGRVGLLVDRVGAAFDVDAGSVMPGLATLPGEVARYVRGQVRADGETRTVLDLERVLTNPEIDVMVRE